MNVYAHRFAGWLIAAVLLCALPGAVAASAGETATPATFSELLAEADKVRSAKPQQFRQLLAELDKRRAEAAPSQRDQLAVLHAYAWAYDGKYERAVEDATAIFDTAKDVNVKFRAGLLIANSFAINRNFDEGLRALNQTLPLRSRVTDPALRQDGLSVGAVLYNQLGQYELGLTYAEEILSGSPSPRGRCFAGQLRLEALYNLGKLPPKDDALNRVIDACSQQGELVVTNLARNYLARKWAAEGRVHDAIALLDQHLPQVQSTHYPRLIGETHALLAEYRFTTGDLAGAEHHAHAAIDSSGLDYSLPLANAYKTLYDVDVKRNDLQAALTHYRSYAEADRAYLDVVKARELAFQLARHETQQKTQKIELLNKRNQVLQLQQRVSRQATQNTQLIAVLLAVLLATIGYWAYKTKRMQMSFRRLAETDTLTGVSNRHHFTRQAEEALAYCERTGQDSGLIMFDLDLFKSINDRFGHATGDHVLKLVARESQRHCRKNDRFGRIGGEEFAILLIGCDLDATLRMAKVLCTHIAGIDTGESGHRFPVSASFGVTTASRTGYDLTRMMCHADEAMYQAKREGRGTVCQFSQESREQRHADAQIA
ncbi:GGDEF domain-containing protein [Lysobacter fragariae]